MADAPQDNDGSIFWTDALDPKNGAKIIAVYPSGSTVDFTATARKTTEGRDRFVSWYGDLKAAVKDASVDMHHPSMRECPTCRPISVALREPWGCYAYQAKRGKAQDFAK